MAFSCPPATEEQLRITEEQLGFPLPPLLRMMYRDVANGGNGLIWYDEQFPLIGAHGGYPSPPGGKSSNGQYLWGPTIEQLISRSGWTLHSCIETALWRHPERYVICSDCPDKFVRIMDVGSQAYELDVASGRIYESWFYGDLPLDDNQSLPLLSLNFYRSSLEDIVEEYLAHGGFSNRAVTRPTQPSCELTPDELDPACETDSAMVWHGIYRGVEEIINPRPDHE